MSPAKAALEFAYFDTSAIVKRYVVEAGMKRVRERFEALRRLGSRAKVLVEFPQYRCGRESVR